MTQQQKGIITQEALENAGYEVLGYVGHDEQYDYWSLKQDDANRFMARVGRTWREEDGEGFIGVEDNSTGKWHECGEFVRSEMDEEEDLSYLDHHPNAARNGQI